jgi:NADH-quinone oxidoreductase subunit N
MQPINFTSLIPIIIIAASPVVLILVIAIKRNHFTINILSLLFLLAAFISVISISGGAPVRIEPLFIIDGYALFYIGLLTAASFIVVILAYKYLDSYKGNKEEFYVLLFTALLGSSILTISKHFVSFFLGLEILSVSLYTLIAYSKEYKNALEGGAKYLILAAVSSAFLLFGMALIYAETGSMDFYQIAMRLPGITFDSVLVSGGIAMIIVGVGFKLAVVPFHMWTPDVYQGASAPVSAFIASVSKGGMLALLLRFFGLINLGSFGFIMLIFTIISIASMVAGNLLALLQKNVKRILAYSSIANFGYMLVAFIAAGNVGIEAATFYLTAYFIMILGSFGIVSVLYDGEREPEDIEDYRGLFWRRPMIALVFTAMLFSLAGIPLTAGFIGKYYLLAAGVNSSLWLLVFVLVGTSVIGLFYYLRIIKTMFQREEEGGKEAAQPRVKVHVAGGLALAFLTIILIWFGVLPSGLLSLLRTMLKM